MLKVIKKVIATVLAAVILSLPVTVNAVSNPAPAGGVAIESSLAVSNATSGDGKYHDTVSAKVDEVVKIEVWYHNTQLPDSGKVAQNLNVKIDIPGENTTNHQVTSSVGGSNTNTETDLATVTTAVSSNLEYIPDTAYRRHNTGTNQNQNWVTEKISDSVVTASGYVIPTMNPCWNFQETITVQARVKASSLSILKQVKVEGTNTWQTKITANPGDTLAYLITFKNVGNVKLNNVIIRDSLPPKLEYVKGSAKLINVNYPNGYTLSDNLIGSGVNIGNYTVGSNAYVRLQAKVPATSNSGSVVTYKNVGVAKADTIGEYYNIAEANVTYKTVPQTEVQIKITKYNDRNGNKYPDKGEEGLAGVRFEISGNGIAAKTVTTDSVGYIAVTGLKTGTYTVKEIVPEGWENTTGLSITRNVSENEDSQIFFFGNKKKATPTPLPTPTPKVPELPVTGPAEAVGIVLSLMGVGGSSLAYRRSKKGLIGSLKNF